ncbi:unnamed protein product [Paramecium sonneborni]|uniref:Uncharacterized protein n=1 Tax=Paramecium sonneborni TaxID=65129 RepID=A0A8S1P1V2_9CILI|nr:unnamed protein product [Paramecium sonneborni]
MINQELEIIIRKEIYIDFQYLVQIKHTILLKKKRIQNIITYIKKKEFKERKSVPIISFQRM